MKAKEVMTVNPKAISRDELAAKAMQSLQPKLAELQKKYGARLNEATTRLMQEAMRVSNVPGGKVALDAMDGR